MSKCRYCPAVLKWKQPYKKGDFPVELDGKKHNCPNRRQSSRESMYNFDMWAEPSPPRKKYTFCGKCKTLCKEEDVFQWWCNTCKMFPSVTHDGNDELYASFEANPDVKPLMVTNHNEVCEKYRTIAGEDAPINWVHMNEDGTIKNGYKLTKELTKWFEKEGREVIIKMYSEIWYKKKELK